MAATDQSPQRARLRAYLEARRGRLRLTIDQVAATAGIRSNTYARVRDGDADIQPATVSGLEDALCWAPGSIQRILDGGDPVETSAAANAAEPSYAEDSLRGALDAGDTYPSGAARPPLHDLARDWNLLQGLTWVPHPDDPTLRYYVLRRLHRGRIWTHPQTVPATTPFEEVWRQLTAEQDEQLARIDEALGAHGDGTRPE
ncbi:hypothetical protein [Streptomonospora litoralis]|uniref:Uncharacterized protein n=1 Tax=Streptomonospora litoralis TaxID=2498135 RepID=A0A4P6Q813_9ACTN|nr:hypothetical protein [Streptomonospora litoralis]QBI56883.1 hypothetical protein EKD16_25715 [Streptomonospora litoralis]